MMENPIVRINRYVIRYSYPPSVPYEYIKHWRFECTHDEFLRIVHKMELEGYTIESAGYDYSPED